MNEIDNYDDNDEVDADEMVAVDRRLVVQLAVAICPSILQPHPRPHYDGRGRIPPVVVKITLQPHPCESWPTSSCGVCDESAAMKE